MYRCCCCLRRRQFSYTCIYWFIYVLFWLIIIFCHHKIKWIKEFTTANNNNDGYGDADGDGGGGGGNNSSNTVELDETISPASATVHISRAMNSIE